MGQFEHSIAGHWPEHFICINLLIFSELSELALILAYFKNCCDGKKTFQFCEPKKIRKMFAWTWRAQYILCDQAITYDKFMIP